VTERERDGRGNIVAVRRLAGGAPSPPLAGATYAYNALGEILEVIDFNGNLVVRTDCDLLGQRVRLESPDAGLVELAYDEAGNLIRKTDSVRRGRGEAVTYRYDGHNRLVAVDYPRSADVGYRYGDPGASDNRAGRLVEREDESGVISYRYGKLGETVGMQRRLERLTPLATPVEASFTYLYDYLGRLERITYPDGEVLTYGYDRGGQVTSATGLHYGRSTSYLQQIGYDSFGQRVLLRYGNGVETRYVYDENRRWLTAIRTQDSWGQAHQDIAYRFDLVGNVEGVANTAARYETRQTYVYDPLDQLIGANGTTTARPHGIAEYSSSYTQNFNFDAIANMTAKRSSSRTTPARVVGAALGYELDYAYYPEAPHRAERIGGLWYRYDGNGNVAEEREGGHGTDPLEEGTLTREGDVRVVNRGFGLVRHPAGGESVYERRFAWDEENRLMRAAEGQRAVEFRYGADGARSLKYSGSAETLYFDALWQATTDYPDLRRSKHIYVGETRVATRLNIEGHTDAGYEELNTYYYHGDHLGSAQVVSDYRGDPYERMEYTPYGELWVEEKSDAFDRIPFRFTAKEWDEETSLYYYGARYLDPRSSRWASPDPALASYLPAPGGDPAGLPGEGGVFNDLNLALYGYAGNNPVRYTDPSGAFLDEAVKRALEFAARNPAAAAAAVATAPLWLSATAVAAQAAVGLAALGFVLSLQGSTTSTPDELSPSLPANFRYEHGNVITPSGAISNYQEAWESVAAVGGGLPYLGPNGVWEGDILSTTAGEELKLYRVWGGDSNQIGAWLSATRPANAASARASLALPPQNTAEYVSEVTVPAGTRLQIGIAGKHFGQPGGGVQVMLLDRIPASNFGAGVPLE